MGTSVTQDIENSWNNGTNPEDWIYDNSKLQDRRDGNVSKI